MTAEPVPEPVTAEIPPLEPPPPEPEPQPAPVPEPQPAPVPEPEPGPGPEPVETEHGRRGPQLTSPIVRRLVAERGLDPSTITGTGPGGRLTRKDVLDAAATPAPAGPRASRPAAGRGTTGPTPAPGASDSCFGTGAHAGALTGDGRHPSLPVNRRRLATRSCRSTTSVVGPLSTWCGRRPRARTCTRRSRSTSNASNACGRRTRWSGRQPRASRSRICRSSLARSATR